MKRLLLIFLCVAIHPDASAERRRHRAPFAGKLAGLTSGAGEYVFSSYDDWDFYWQGSDFAGASGWPAATESEIALDLSSDGAGDGTGGQSTSGLSNVGVNTNEAVAAASGSSYEDPVVSLFPAISDGEDIHFRLVINYGSIAASDWLFAMQNNGTNGINIYTVNTTQMRLRVLAGGSAYDCTQTVSECIDAWCLIDIYYDDQGASAEQTTFYVNGTEKQCAAGSVTASGVAGGGSVSLLNDPSAGFGTEDATVLGFGMRRTTSFTEAEHDADVSGLGL